MSIYYSMSIFIHLLAACFWIGGMLFLPLVLLPGIKDSPERVALLYRTGLRFRTFGLIALGLLLVTGLLQIHLRGIPFSWAFWTSSAYGIKVGIKIGLFVLILAINSIHDLLLGKRAVTEQTQSDERFRKLARWTGRLVLVISLAMAYIGVLISRGM